MLVSINYLLILGTASKWAFKTLLSSLRSSEKVSNITLLDEVKRTIGGVQAPGPHHLKYPKNGIKNLNQRKPKESVSHIPVIFAEKGGRSNTHPGICSFRSIPLATTSLLVLHPVDSTQDTSFPAPSFSHSGWTSQTLLPKRCLEFSDLQKHQKGSARLHDFSSDRDTEKQLVAPKRQQVAVKKCWAQSML